jgi:hypothetical protein
MRKEYDLRSLKVKRRGPAAAAALVQKNAASSAGKASRGGSMRAKRHR